MTNMIKIITQFGQRDEKIVHQLQYVKRISKVN